MAWHGTREERQARKEADLAAEYAWRVLIGKGAAFVLTPLRCAIPKCNNLAVIVDCFAPFFTDLNRCKTHAPPPSASSEKEESGE